jgi:hypothetical protein
VPSRSRLRIVLRNAQARAELPAGSRRTIAASRIEPHRAGAVALLAVAHTDPDAVVGGPVGGCAAGYPYGRLQVVGELPVAGAFVARCLDCLWCDGGCRRHFWSEGSITQPAVEEDEPATESTTSEMIKYKLQFDMSPALRARAVEMLAYLVTQDAVEATLNVVRDHPEAEVRRAAIDAHIFNQGSTQEVLDALAPYVRPEDEPYVNVPHWLRDMDPDEFDTTVAELMAADGAPPPPKRAEPPIGKTYARHHATEPGPEPSHEGEDSRNV